MAKLFGGSLAHALHMRPGCAVVADVPLGTGLKRHCLAARLAQRTAFASAVFHPESEFELAVQPFPRRNDLRGDDLGRRSARHKASYSRPMRFLVVDVASKPVSLSAR